MQFVRVLTLAISGVILYLWRFQVAIEIKQLRSMGWLYFKDHWNWIDATQLLLNLLFLVFLNIDVLVGYTLIETSVIRTMGAIGCFLCWIKIFYWMRIFRQTASFVTLIFQTLYDVRIFMYMLLIIMLAFANFFYIMNFNQVDKDADLYVAEYGLGGFLDAIMNSYFISLGEFSYDSYSSTEGGGTF